ncbi:flavin reductase family protein [Rhizobium sp. SSA_523]|uniref:flavin reductase family protein n=1 Tax=Rhizobium sp. SSA_523 TaxID=2952477 RepID=UPI00209017F5|nr:flavin reductase family protein [Rhizobium sp. SSA_523]MCO5733294.1 flavin reductase family protein [Rhizobium sp. SSA_523]WKC21723.1 flavin reductase family protein [Rhizobium sp. SSA_523]
MTKQHPSQAFDAETARPVADVRPADAASLKAALRGLAGGVSVVTVGEGQSRTGATVTSATALSIDPPRMLVSLNRTSSTWTVLQQSGAFGVNILGAGHEGLANQFAGIGGLQGQERYDGYEWTSLSTSVALLEDAVAGIDCVVEEAIERYSHVIVTGAVQAVRLTGGRSLVYQNGAYHRLI